jgi:hypothetical protein
MYVESYQMANFGGQISFPSCWVGRLSLLLFPLSFGWVGVLSPSPFWVGRVLSPRLAESPAGNFFYTSRLH